MSKKLTVIEVLERFKKIHGNKYDYSKVIYVNNHTKVHIICPIHGEFNQSPYCHYGQKHECPKCGDNKIREKLSLNKEEFTFRANKIHNNKYDYSKFNYINIFTNGIIVCPIHGDFLQMPNTHLRKGGCPKCGRDIQRLSMIYSNEEYIHLVQSIHGNKYDYSKVNYDTSHKKICIICKNHGEFWQTANSHLCGCGCPKCVNIISKMEMEFLNYLNIPDTEKHRQKHIKPYKIDGFDDKTNTIYEFLGDYYHGNSVLFDQSKYNQKCHKTFGELYKNTFRKFDVLKSLGYNIKYIWELDWKKYKTGLEIKPNIITH